MEIHGPDKAVHSWKDFGIHIAIVTIGILIALSLEGVRETVHEHRLVRDARDTFRVELQMDQKHAGLELEAVVKATAQLKKLTEDYPELAQKHPEEIAARLEAVQNPFYFFPANGWQTALSSSAMAHMSTEEVNRYANMYELIRDYSSFQGQGLTAQDRAKAYFSSHPKPSAAELSEGAERLFLFLKAEESMQSVCKQLKDDLDKVMQTLE